MGVTLLQSYNRYVDLFKTKQQEILKIFGL